MPGLMELMVVLVIVLIIFGAGKLPQIGEALGRGIRNFKKATREADEIEVSPKEKAQIAEAKGSDGPDDDVKEAAVEAKPVEAKEKEPA